MTYCSTGGLSLSDLLRKRSSPRSLGFVPSVASRVQDRPPRQRCYNRVNPLLRRSRSSRRRCSVERGDVFPHAAAIVVLPPELLHLDGDAAGAVRVQHVNGLAHPTYEIAYHSHADAWRSAGGTRSGVPSRSRQRLVTRSCGAWPSDTAAASSRFRRAVRWSGFAHRSAIRCVQRPWGHPGSEPGRRAIGAGTCREPASDALDVRWPSALQHTAESLGDC
jgi:hypothetical protein